MQSESQGCPRYSSHRVRASRNCFWTSTAAWRTAWTTTKKQRATRRAPKHVASAAIKAHRYATHQYQHRYCRLCYGPPMHPKRCCARQSLQRSSVCWVSINTRTSHRYSVQYCWCCAIRSNMVPICAAKSIRKTTLSTTCASKYWVESHTCHRHRRNCQSSSDSCVWLHRTIQPYVVETDHVLESASSICLPCIHAHIGALC
jgi:hypothetical protein